MRYARRACSSGEANPEQGRGAEAGERTSNIMSNMDASACKITL